MDYFDFGLEDIKKFVSQYTTKIKIPTYTPHNLKPRLSQLVDERKYRMLVKKIMIANISDKDKQFLFRAAARHRVFDYSKIADYYAHSSKEIQELMEDSALIIIDFDKAIEQGFINLSEQIVNQYKKDYSDEEQ